MVIHQILERFHTYIVNQGDQYLCIERALSKIKIEQRNQNIALPDSALDKHFLKLIKWPNIQQQRVEIVSYVHISCRLFDPPNFSMLLCLTSLRFSSVGWI